MCHLALCKIHRSVSLIFKTKSQIYLNFFTVFLDHKFRQRDYNLVVWVFFRFFLLFCSFSNLFTFCFNISKYQTFPLLVVKLSFFFLIQVLQIPSQTIFWDSLCMCLIQQIDCRGSYALRTTALQKIPYLLCSPQPALCMDNMSFTTTTYCQKAVIHVLLTAICVRLRYMVSVPFVS